MEWKYIKNYDLDYTISDKGEIRRRGRVVKPFLVKGVKAINLWKNGERKTRSVHILYADAFGISRTDADRIINKGYEGNSEAKDRVKSWLHEKIIECEKQSEQGVNVNDEILYLQECMKIL